MAVNYQYNYAVIDVATGMCIGVQSTSMEIDDPTYIEIPVCDEDYILKFYINDAWYEDIEGTIPWSSSLA